ncbi:MAG: hypothetical protein Q3966_04945 [Neisseria sp.]|nr:hypothetical protein [Neisseria sp.]
MKYLIPNLLVLLSLAACATTPSGGNSQMYGEINAGVETSHTK